MFVGIGDVSQKGKLFKRWNKLLDISSTLGTSVVLKPSSIFFFPFIILIYFLNDLFIEFIPRPREYLNLKYSKIYCNLSNSIFEWNKLFNHLNIKPFQYLFTSFFLQNATQQIITPLIKLQCSCFTLMKKQGKY